jgi:hypothetical protein
VAVASSREANRNPVNRNLIRNLLTAALG